MPSLAEIFAVFFKIGMFTFGGGGVMIAWIQDELVRKKKWLKDEDFLDFYAIAQCTPGIIAINVATMVGYAVRKKAGAVVSTVAVILPSIMVILLIASLLPDITTNVTVMHAFNGIRASVVAIITNVAVNMLINNVKDWRGRSIFALAFLLLIMFAISPVTTVIFGCAAGISAQKIPVRKKEKI